MISSLTGGIIGDRIAASNHLNLSRICYMGAACASPFIMAGTLITGNFFLALSCIILRVLIGECFWGPSMSMIQQSVPQEELSSYVSAWQFFNYTSGGLITILIGSFVSYFGLANSPVALGRLLAAVSFFTYLGSTLSWWKAGKEFQKL